jgi:hypothetical protein
MMEYTCRRLNGDLTGNGIALTEFRPDETVKDGG